MTNPTYPNGYQEPLDPQLDDDSFIVKRYVSLFISNWYWFAMSLFTALTIVYCINRYSEKIFTVSSSLLIKDEKGGELSFGKNIMPGSNVFNSQQNLNNEIGILKSFRLNKRVIDSLPEFKIVYFGVGKRNIVESRLYKDSPFQVKAEAIDYQPSIGKIYITITSAKTYLLESIGKTKIGQKQQFGDRYKEHGFNFIINLRDSKNFIFEPEKSNKYYFYFMRSEDLASYYMGKLDVSPVSKDATLINLSSSGPVPEQEVDYLNKLMELYIWDGLESKNQTADSTIKFIDRQIKLISDSLIKAEDNLQNFRLENKLVNISEEGTLIQNQVEKFENEKAILELQYQYYQYLKEYLGSRNESGDIISPSVMGVSDPGLGRLVLELAVLQQKKKQLSMNLSAELPPVNLSEENIIIAKKALSENVESGLFNLEQSLADVNKRIAMVSQEIIKLPGTEREMISIKRKFDLNNTVYTYLLEKRAETGIARASNVSDNKIIDEAEIYNSSQINPRPRSNDLKALIIGLFMPGLIIVLLYYFNNRIIDNGDILKRTSVPIVGYVSHNENIKEIPVIDSPGSALSESFRSIRTTLRYFIKETPHPVIAITSTISSEGKTFISINLAAVIALLGKKVLLIGLDLRKPRIHKIIGIDNSEGMSTYLSSNCEYDDVIKETSISNLYYASSGPVPPNPAELIDDERMNTFIEKAKKEFDYIIIDTPPIAVVSDTLLISGFVDINMFVVRQRFSSKNTLELIQELYKGEKLKNMGIIINDISLYGYYGYGLRYGYYRGYGYSYGKNYYGQYSYYRYGYSEKEHDYYNS
jgi:capsular exopolysaccharide synthesis family protein